MAADIFVPAFITAAKTSIYRLFNSLCSARARGHGTAFCRNADLPDAGRAPIAERASLPEGGLTGNRFGYGADPDVITRDLGLGDHGVRAAANTDAMPSSLRA